MSKHYYKTHIENGHDHTLCGLTIIQKGRRGVGILPVVAPSKATCKNCFVIFHSEASNNLARQEALRGEE